MKKLIINKTKLKRMGFMFSETECNEDICYDEWVLGEGNIKLVVTTEYTSIKKVSIKNQYFELFLHNTIERIRIKYEKQLLVLANIVRTNNNIKKKEFKIYDFA